MPRSPRRRSLRLPGYDYTRPGAYFITLCTHKLQALLSQVVDGEVQPSEWGEIVQEEWLRSADMRREIELHQDEFFLMPNHLHTIVWIVDGDMTPAPRAVGATGRSPLPKKPPRGPEPSNRRRQNGSMPCAARRGLLFGSGIIMNISSGMKPPCNPTHVTLPKTPCGGIWIATIPTPLLPIYMSVKYDNFLE